MTSLAEQLPPVEEVVPHSGPMVLLDRLIGFTEEEGLATAEVVLRGDSMFVRDGKARAVVTVEYMAQAVAAYVGLIAKKKGGEIEIGFLIGIREMKLHQSHLHAGDVLEVEAKHVWGDMKLGSFRAAVRRGSEEIASATLTVFRGDLPEEAS